jgi:branched-chain amino acid transport system ATP-binding protein
LGGGIVLTIEHLDVAYGDIQVLHDIAFTVPPKGSVGVLGANGAGKTTLLKTVSGLVRPRSGTITLNDVELTEQPAHDIPNLGVAHVPEGRHVFPTLTVMDNLLLGDYTKRLKDERNEILASVLDLFPRLKERSKQLAGSLSGGEQQMLAVGRALMLRPTLLMLDEPSLGLAPIVVDEMFTRLAQIYEEWETSILLVEQNAVQALELIEEAIVLENGKVAFKGSKQELEDTPYVQQSYLGL